MRSRGVPRGVDRFDRDVEAAARASAPDGEKSLGALRFTVVQLVAGLGALALALVAVVGDFPLGVVRLVLAVTAGGCAVVFVLLRRTGSVGTRFGLVFLTILMAIAALIAATIQPAPLGTLTGFVFLGLAVCVAAAEPVPVAIVFGGVAIALGLAAITSRSVVAIAAATIFVSITVLAVFVVIRFRMIVSGIRDRAVADSLTDPLTGLGNRRRMDVAVTMLGQIAERTGQSIGCLVIDIDHFKAVNDQRGHEVGDQVLRATATTIAATVRAGDLLVRLGGDEFAVFTITSSTSSLSAMGERVRLAVESSDASPLVTVSVGGALASAVTPDGVTDLVALSDRALYGAKQSGRNTVRVEQKSADQTLA